MKIEIEKVLSDFSFILVEPGHPGNIGSIARVLKNTGFVNLSMVNPVDFYTNSETKALAFQSFDILDNAKIFSNFNDAIAPYDIIIATSNKIREDKKTIFPEDIIQIKNKTKAKSIGILFGSERNGLALEHLNIASYYCYIPAYTSYPSYNLAQAVMIIAYTIFRNISKVDIRNHYTLIKQQEKNKLIEFIENNFNIKPSMKNGILRLLSHSFWDDKDLRFFYRFLQSIKGTFK